jgi:DNA-binding CsgD family transcriptional regulator
MNGIIKFSITTLSICSGFFTLGACVFLYIQHRTKILRLSLIFLLSLIIIGIGFWTSAFRSVIGELHSSDTRIIQLMLQEIGVVANVLVLPFLISALVSIPIRKKMMIIIWVWDGILIISALLYPFLPKPVIVLSIVNGQLVLTIAVCLVFILINLKKLHNKTLSKALAAFLVVSGVFLILLIFDILISRLSFENLSVVDNLSLPVYFIALNIGSFFFAGRFLNREPLMKKDNLTASCIGYYNLTGRETEIIEMLVRGMTNQELADSLFISKKTVENHLYSIYQKMDVKNRMHLLQILNIWKRES